MIETVSRDFIDLLYEVFFRESHFIKTIKTYKNWTTINRKIQPRELHSHFKGRYYIGFILRETPVNFFSFDLDCHDLKAKETLRARYKKIIALFGYPSIISSTPSGGLHLYYFLTTPHFPCEMKSIVSDVLTLQNGYIELFPSNKGLRLFGGCNSSFLNHSLKPICGNPHEFQEYFTQVYSHSERVSLEDLKGVQKQRQLPKLSKQSEQKIMYLIKNGLPGPHTRNQALLDLSRYYQNYLDYSETYTTEILIKWISEKHNGQSHDWNKNHQGVIKHIQRLVTHNDLKKIGKKPRVKFDRTILSDENLNYIEALSFKLSMNLNTDLRKVETFLQDLFSYCKKNHIDGIVYIPSKVFKACQNGSGKRYFRIKEELIKNGALIMQKNYSTISHKCRSYKILDDFIL